MLTYMYICRCTYVSVYVSSMCEKYYEMRLFCHFVTKIPNLQVKFKAKQIFFYRFFIEKKMGKKYFILKKNFF